LLFWIHLVIVSLLLYHALVLPEPGPISAEGILHIQHHSGRSQSCRTVLANPRALLHLVTDHTPVGRVQEESTATRTSFRRIHLLPLASNRERWPRQLASTRTDVNRLLGQTPSWIRAKRRDNSTLDLIGCSKLLHRLGRRRQTSSILAHRLLRMLCDNSMRVGKTVALSPRLIARRASSRGDLSFCIAWTTNIKQYWFD